MKRMKKVFAVLLTLAMVLGMSITVFADLGTAVIPVNGAKEGTQYQYLQLIRPQASESTGWEFVNDAVAGNFTAALQVSDAQTAIWMLIKSQDLSITGPADVTAATEAQIKAAITNVANGGYTLSEAAGTITVSDAGMYYIRATAPGYTYNPMAAYVSFGYTGGVPSSLQTQGVTAKGTEIKTEKSSDEVNKVTEIGRTETYYVGSIVPFVPMGDTNRSYIVKDEIQGAEYIAENGKITLTVYYGAEGTTLEALIASVKSENPPAAEGAFTTDVTGSSFTADLSTILENNAHANQPIVITYQAKVTGVTAGNKVSIGDGANFSQFGSGSESLFTGKLTITKKDSSDQTFLDGAKFLISKGAGDSKKYAKFNTDNKFTEWVDTESDALYVTAVNGTVTVEGLDEGTYHIEEKVAPDGYSINEKIEDVTLSVEGEAAAVLEGTREVLDTKLSSLPSTGGIGTTIFTIGGCLIMIVAAGLFFATRKKSAK